MTTSERGEEIKKFISTFNESLGLSKERTGRVLEIEKFDKEEDLVSTKQENIKDFISWVSDNYPDKLEQFTDAKNNI